MGAFGEKSSSGLGTRMGSKVSTASKRRVEAAAAYAALPAATMQPPGSYVC